MPGTNKWRTRHRSGIENAEEDKSLGLTDFLCQNQVGLGTGRAPFPGGISTEQSRSFVVHIDISDGTFGSTLMDELFARGRLHSCTSCDTQVWEHKGRSRAAFRQHLYGTTITVPHNDMCSVLLYEVFQCISDCKLICVLTIVWGYYN